MKTPTKTLAAALRQLANDIESPDGVANAAIAEAAERLEELVVQIEVLQHCLSDLVNNGKIFFDEDYDSVKAILQSTPTQCLRQIQAEAVLAYNKQLSADLDNEMPIRFLQAHGDHYAERVKRGEL